MTKQSKFASPEEAVRAVRAGDWVDYGFGGGFPELLDRALAARRDELSEVKIRGGLVIRPRIEAVECDPEQKAFSYYSWHIADYERKLQSRGLCRFLPMVLRYLPELYRSHIRVDTAFVPVSRPDGEGYCGLGISNYAWRTIFEQARTVIFEINEQLPTLQGVDGSHRVHLSEADFVVEGAHEPLPIRTYKDPSPIDVQIAEHVVREIPNGATLSLGVGSTWNLAMGSQELYNWLQAESDRFRPGDVDYVHSPERMGQISNFISINGGVQLDLMGQENAESAGSRQLSGTGGQLDFLEGAFRSKGGKGFICLNSSRLDKTGTRKSNIVPFIPGGSTVSAPRSLIEYVATEYGVVRLTGLSLGERAKAMISIAHPDFREELAQYAREHFQ